MRFWFACFFIVIFLIHGLVYVYLSGTGQDHLTNTPNCGD